MPRRNLIWLAAILAAAGATALVVRTPAPQVGGPPAMPAPLERAQRLIRENYYRPIPAEDLNCAAVSGMVAALDEFSSFIPPEKVDAFQRRMAGKICGLGLVVEFRDGQVRVVGPLPDSPAHRAGLFGGDRILSVNGRAVAAETIEKVRELLDCPDESPVRLELLRAAGRRETVHLAPREFPLETVTGLARGPDGAWIYLVAPDEGIAYFRIREFTEDTGQQFQRAVRQLSRLGGVVLDLRGNPGGARPAAIEVADLFLRDGPIVVIEGRDGQSSPHAAREAGTLPDVPVVVLVDSHTASAAELVAGALRAADRAVLVGERTTGKRCIQTMIPLGGDMGQINLTTAWFRFEHEDPAASALYATFRRGIEPHVAATVDEACRRDLADLREQSLVLPPPAAGEAAQTQPATTPEEPTAERLLKLDAPLVRAVELIETPARMEAILREAAASRSAELKARQAKTRAARAGAEKSSGGAQDAPGER